MRSYLSIGYSLGSHYWQARAGLSRDLGALLHPTRITFEGHIITDTRDGWKMGSVENTLAALIAGVDTRDYFQRRGGSLRLEDFLTARTSVALLCRSEDYRNAPQRLAWSLLGPPHPFRSDPGVREGNLTSLAIRVVHDGMTRRSVDSTRFAVAAEFELGLAADRFESYVVDLRWKSVPMARLLGLALHGRFGSVVGEALPQRSFSIGGFGTVPGYSQNEYRGNRMLLLQGELSVSPLPRISLLRDLRLLLSNDFATVATAPLEAGPLDGIVLRPSAWRYSPGIYLTSPASRWRIGVAWRTDRAATPRFIVRLAERF